MDYKEKVIALLNSQELSKEQKENLENIFPELKENEDEKIKKDIIAFLRSKNGYMTPDEDWDFHNRWLVWLEKQREKLDPDKVIGWLIANICDFEYYVKFVESHFWDSTRFCIFFYIIFVNKSVYKVIS